MAKKTRRKAGFLVHCNVRQLRMDGAVSGSPLLM